jgi:hypothetical protein
MSTGEPDYVSQKGRSTCCLTWCCARRGRRVLSKFERDGILSPAALTAARAEGRLNKLQCALIKHVNDYCKYHPGHIDTAAAVSAA